MKKENDRSGVEEEEEHEAEKRDENDDKEEEEKEDNEEDDEDAKAHYHVEPRKKRKKGCDAINKEVPTTAPLPMFAEGGTPQPKREFRKRPSEDPSAFETPVKAKVRKQSRAFKCMADAETEAHGSKPDCSLATATGHGSKPATSSTVTSTTFTRDAPAKRNQKKEQEAEEEDDELQAELLCAQAHLQKCLTNEDYTGAVAAKEIDDALTETLARAAPAKHNHKKERTTIAKLIS